MDVTTIGMLSAFFMACFSSLFTIINPLSTTSVFIAMTEGISKEEKINIAKRATITAAIILIIFGFFGRFILSFFSITIDAFRLAGGLLVANVGLRMISGNGKNKPPKPKFIHAPMNPVIEEPVLFMSESTDPDGFITKEEWFINEVKVGQGHSFTYVFDNPGTYNVLLKVTDNKGSTENIVKQVIVLPDQDNLLPIPDFEYTPRTPKEGHKITFKSLSYDEGGEIKKEEWFVNGVLETTFTHPESTMTKRFKAPGTYNVVLRITDDKGIRIKTVKQIIIAPKKMTTDTKLVSPTRINMDSEDIAIIPLAIPMLSGPGAMTTSLMLMSEAKTVSMMAIAIFSILLVCILSFLLLKHADKVSKKLGKTGRKIVDKMLGLIVLVVGVQFIINGIRGVLLLWGFL